MLGLLYYLLGLSLIVYINFFSCIDPVYNIPVIGGTIVLIVGPSTVTSFLGNSFYPAQPNSVKLNTPGPSLVNAESLPIPPQGERYPILSTRQLM